MCFVKLYIPLVSGNVTKLDILAGNDRTWTVSAFSNTAWYEQVLKQKRPYFRSKAALSIGRRFAKGIGGNLPQ